MTSAPRRIFARELTMHTLGEVIAAGDTVLQTVPSTAVLSS
ncbi:hypothetical protein M728_004086 (plasmid) [Ensifer sp. WSM1721]|nr:hypothetical protein [Ensifer sp. WSM1721]